MTGLGDWKTALTKLNEYFAMTSKGTLLLKKWPLKKLLLKVPGPISQNGDTYSNDASSPKKSWFQIPFQSVKPFGCKKRLCILQLPIPYCISLIMVTITSHIFINIFQTVHFSAVKFTTGVMRKIWAFFWYQNLQKFEKNLKQSDRAPLISDVIGLCII